MKITKQQKDDLREHVRDTVCAEVIETITNLLEDMEQEGTTTPSVAHLLLELQAGAYMGVIDASKELGDKIL